MTKEELVVANIELRETLVALRDHEETLADDGEEDRG